MSETVIQIIGFLGIALSLISVQFNTHGKIMLFKTSSSALFCLQYLLMGAYTGMVMDMVGTARNIVFAYNVKKGKSTKPWIIFFSVLTFTLGITTIVLTWGSLVNRVSWLAPDNFPLSVILAVTVSLISIVAKILTTVAYGFKDAHRIRMTNLPSCSGWLIYNFVVFSLAGMINETMCLISILIAELRFRKKPNEQKEEINANKKI